MPTDPSIAVDPALIAFANQLADAARGETLPRWRTFCPPSDKGGDHGFDPVTEADVEAERAMRRLIEKRFPDHGIAGEELAERDSASAYCWSLDPIDGTRSYICGLPHWVTLIALLEDGRPILGLIDAPCLDERYVGFAGRASLTNAGGETRLATNGCSALGEARFSTTDPGLFEPADLPRFERLRGKIQTARFGLDGYGYARLCAGSLDLLVEAGLKPHDLNALIPLVRASGGMIGDWRGGEDFSAGKLIAAASRELFERAVEALC